MLKWSRRCLCLLRRSFEVIQYLELCVSAFKTWNWTPMSMWYMFYSDLCAYLKNSSSLESSSGLTKKSRDAGTTPGQYSTAARRPGVVLSGPSRPIRSS